jgi:hypothetical protein
VILSRLTEADYCKTTELMIPLERLPNLKSIRKSSKTPKNH